MNWPCVFFGLAFIALGRLCAGRTDEHTDGAPSARQRSGELVVLSGVIFLLNGLLPWFREHWFILSLTAWGIVSGLELMNEKIRCRRRKEK